MATDAPAFGRLIEPHEDVNRDAVHVDQLFGIGLSKVRISAV